MKNIFKMFGNLTRDYRKQVSKQQYTVPLVIIAIITIIGLSMTACGEDDSNSSNKGGSIKVEQLPEFPSGSNPAESKADAEAILAELRKTRIIESIDEEIWSVIRENTNGGYYIGHENYSFSNRSLPDGSVRVSASYSENETNTGGFKKLYEYYNEEERNKIQFNKGDRSSEIYNENYRAELIKVKTEDGVTILKGSIFEEKYNNSSTKTVSTAGIYRTFRTDYSYSGKYQNIYAFTVTTTSGSVKVILDMISEGSGVGNNVLYYSDEEDDVGTWTETGEKFPGSLKVFGSNNVLLIDYRIVDWASYDTALYMINYDPYTLNPADAIPLTINSIEEGDTSEDSVVLYSINVTSGTKYHLWWWWWDIGHTYVRVRGYYSDGNVFFDTDNWRERLDAISSYSFTAASTGTVYIMVYPQRGRGGDFSIVYNTSGNRPAMSVSAAPFRANSGSIQNKMNAGVLRYNKR